MANTEEITDQDKMTAIIGLRADMLKQYNWQKRMLHQIRLVSIGTAFTLLICLSISVYLVFRPDSATEIDLKYIHSESVIINSRRQGVELEQQTLVEERKSFEKEKAIFVVAQALSDSNMKLREIKADKPLTVKANNVNTKNINVVNAKTVIKK